jgi:hypothetical protein
VLSGDDGLTLPMIALGADGVGLRGLRTRAPAAMSELVEAALAGDRERGVRLHRRLTPLFRAWLRRVEPDSGEMGGLAARPGRRSTAPAARTGVARRRVRAMAAALAVGGLLPESEAAESAA